LRFDALVFDFDGVLVDSVDVKTRAFEQIYAPHGPSVVEQVVAYHLEHGGLSRLEKFRHCHAALLGRTLGADEEAALGQRFTELVENAVVAAPWIPGAREFLEAHWRRLPLFVASGTPEAELKRIIDRRGMMKYFAEAQGSPATKGEILAGFIARHALHPDRVLMVGDSRTDLEGARAVQAQFLGVSPASERGFPEDVPVLPDLTQLGPFVEDRTTV